MRILEELRKDRAAATQHIRSRLAALKRGRIVFSDVEWDAVTEKRIWQFLVHEEFKVRGVRAFEVVRVPVRKNHTIALDTRRDAARTQAHHGLASVVRTGAISMAMSAFSRSWLRPR